MAPSSPSKQMLAFGASPGPKRRVNVTASTSSSTSSVSKTSEPSKKAKSGGGGGNKAIVQLVAAMAALALAAAVARWLGSGSVGGPSAVVVDVTSRSTSTPEVAFDAEDPDALPLPGLHVDGGNNAPRRSGAVGAWPARVRVERQRLRPRKRGAMEKAVEELSALGLAELVDEGPDTPWDILIPSKTGGLERLRTNRLREGQQVGAVPEPLSSRKNLALVAARSGWPRETVPRAFQLMSEYQDWLDADGGPESPPGTRWIVKAATPGHPRTGHEGYSSLPTAASSTMLPQASFELAQLELPPPAPPAAGLPQVFGARHQLKLFVAVTSVQPPRAYVFDGGVLTLREKEAIAQAVAKTTTKKDDDEGAASPPPSPSASSYTHWMGPWNAADASGLGADAVARQVGRRGARRLRARAEAAAERVFRWLSLPGRIGDPHGDLQFSIAPGSAFEIFAVETVFSSLPGADDEGGDAARNGTARSSSTSAASAWVVDVKPAAAERLGADVDFLMSPALVANAPGCDAAVVGALRSGLEMRLRLREREQAKASGLCDNGSSNSSKKLSSSSPASWSSPGDPCAHFDEDRDDDGDEAWEVEQFAKLGWRRLDLGGSTAPRSLLDKDAPRPAPRRTPRDAASIQAAAEALSRAVNGDVVG